jgi:hypothetical protein
MVEKAIEFVSYFSTGEFLTIKVEALSSRGWVAVPIIDDRYTDQEAQRLATAIHKHVGASHLMAICEIFAYPGEAPASDVWTVLPTEADLKNAEWELSPFYFLLTDTETNFLIWCTKDDWHLLAGPPDFVEDVLGKPLAAARQQFVDFWNEEHRQERGRYHLEWAERLAELG